MLGFDFLFLPFATWAASFGATAAFVNIRGALDTIWGVAPSDRSKKEIALDLLRGRLWGFVMIVFTGATA
jgi:hypothetical protein